MATIDDIMKLKITDKKTQEWLRSVGIEEFTNKAAVIQTLVTAARNGDVKAALFLLENCEHEQNKNKEETPLDKARKKANERKSK